jgi:hypothetical protein
VRGQAHRDEGRGESVAPTVLVYNIAEPFLGFLQRAGDEAVAARLVASESYRGDRGLVSLGSSKLVIASHPIPHAEWLAPLLGYHETQWAAPAAPTGSLCRDIRGSEALIQRLVEHAGPERILRLVPYASTPEWYELVAHLRERGLELQLPESPAPHARWVRDAIDSKSGWKALALRWVSDRKAILPGWSCPGIEAAYAVVQWFAARGQTCIVRCDDGENALGNVVIAPADATAADRVLAQAPFLRGAPVVVEEFVHAPARLFPSVELFVPPAGEGPPRFTYCCNQVFTDDGTLGTLVVDRTHARAPWYARLLGHGEEIAAGLQAWGYVGHFDLDAIVDAEENVRLLEVNARRTAGTHLHELAVHLFGPGYGDEVSVLGVDGLRTSTRSVEELRQALDGLIYPMHGTMQGPMQGPIHGQRMGVIPTVTSALAIGEVGLAVIAPDRVEAFALVARARTCLAAAR